MTASLLQIVRGPDSGRRIELPLGKTVLVGRDESCHLRLEDSSVSRLHCRLTRSETKVTLRDSSSRWGTFVNGERVTDCELHVGDKIVLGETTLKVEAETAPTATIPPPARETPQGNSERDKSQIVTGREEPRGESPAREVRTERELAAANFVGRKFLRFDVIEHVATSTSGLVFRGKNPQTGEAIALKVFQPAALPHEANRKRFLRAVQRMVGLSHENIVPLYTAGRHDGWMFTVSEFVRGESAAAIIQRIGIAGMLDWRTTLRIALDIAKALEFARQQQIVHRNITPRNILVRESDGVAKLNDLVLAKALDGSGAGAAITQPGEIVGELPFLSPEQLESGQPCDHRSDVYQLGATLYSLLTGRPPFEGRLPAETIRQVLTATPERPTRYHLSVPPLLEGIVLRMLSKRPDERFAEPSGLIRDLQAAQKYLGT